MRLKRLTVASTAIAMLAALAASFASANNVTLPSRWYVNGVGLSAGQSAKIKCSVHEEEEVGNKLVIHAEVGEVAPKIKVTLTATGIECINHEGTSEGNGSARIEQTGTGTAENPYRAEAFGRIILTGVTVSEPAHCKVAGGSVTSNPVQIQALTDKANTKIRFNRVTPTGANLATTKIESDGTGACSIEGNRVTKGAICSKAENEAGIMAVNQPVTHSLAVDETVGNTEDSCELIFAGNPAHLTGTVSYELAGANVGQKWGAKEK